MLRSLAVLPLAAPARALADGSSGTLGRGSVGAYELRPGAVAPDRMADMPGGTLLGRAGGPDGPPEALGAGQARELLAAAGPDLVAPDRAAAEALTAPAAAAVLRVLGHAAPGDGGEAWYRRAAGEPAHPGKLATADGAWWELLDREVRPEVFGAVSGDPAVDEGAELQQALDCARATGRALALRRLHATWQDLTLDGPAELRGSGAARLVFKGGAQMRAKRGDGSQTVPDVLIDSIAFEDGADLSPWHGKPLLETWRATRWRITNCRFDGKNRRRFGLWAGRGSTLWASVVDGCRFVSCEYGTVIGDTGDATHNRFTSNTVDHNKVCGAVFANPHGGIIHSNSFEFNEGWLGMAVLSNANGGAAKAVGVSIRGNYVFNNALSRAGDPEAAGMMLGGDVPGGVFTSGLGVWSAEIAHNYIVSDKQVRAIRASLVQGGRIAFNTVGVRSGESFDITLGGSAQVTEVHLNKNQSLPAFDRVESDRAWLEPVTARAGAVRLDGAVETEGGRFGFRTDARGSSDERGGLAYRGDAAAAGGAPGALLSFADIRGADSVLALVSVERTDGSRRASAALHLSAGAEGPVSPLSLTGEADGASFALSAGVLTLTRDGDWTANVTAMFAGGPSSL